MSGGEQKQPKEDMRSNAEFLAGYGFPSQEKAKKELNDDKMSHRKELARVFGPQRFLHNHNLADPLPDYTSVFALMLSEQDSYTPDGFLNILARPLLEDVKAYWRVMVEDSSIAMYRKGLPSHVFNMIQLMLWEDVDRQHLEWKCPCEEDSCECEVWRGRIKCKVRELFQQEEEQC